MVGVAVGKTGVSEPTPRWGVVRRSVNERRGDKEPPSGPRRVTLYPTQTKVLSSPPLAPPLVPPPSHPTPSRRPVVLFLSSRVREGPGTPPFRRTGARGETTTTSGPVWDRMKKRRLTGS